VSQPNYIWGGFAKRIGSKEKTENKKTWPGEYQHPENSPAEHLATTFRPVLAQKIFEYYFYPKLSSLES